MAKTLMIQGCASDVGKSLITAALARIFLEDGFKVAPFKSQNMASNFVSLDNGLKISPPQFIQARAAKIEASSLMNPILLIPKTDSSSELIVNGKTCEDLSAKDYFLARDYYFDIARKSLDSLVFDSNYDIILIEGAGSPSELNLKDTDIVNMSIAKLHNTPVLLVADVSLGGVFASIYGTIKLLDKSEQDLIKACIINKFRGDINLFSDANKIIKEISDKEVIATIPYIKQTLNSKQSDEDFEENISHISTIVRKHINLEKIYEILKL